MTDSLPPPTSDQAYWDISALEAGLIDLRTEVFIDDAIPGEVVRCPSLGFLLRHSKTGDTFVFDLGIRKDWENYPPPVVEWIQKVFPCTVPQDAAESLRKGGLQPEKVKVVCLSHVHFDHVGDTRPFTNSTFLVGGQSKSLFSPGYPADPNSAFASDLLPEGRTEFLDMKDWKPLGPFPRALDYYGDGSLYITDAAGHLPGHINVVARTSADGGWILLGGDSAHHWRLVTGESKIAVGRPGFAGGCAHLDIKASEANLERMRAFMHLPRTRIVLGHDEPWYKENAGGPAFFPGKIPSK
ncbi:Metallo-hydrolase/oxidoreductase [Marasmius fiardii PR-910]|nr:Metallo-hydrolase/oxidoreductase [Marasmius fiardii PR-910]